MGGLTAGSPSAHTICVIAEDPYITRNPEPVAPENQVATARELEARRRRAERLRRGRYNQSAGPVPKYPGASKLRTSTQK